MKHQHILRTNSADEDRCDCGVAICMSLHPDGAKMGCNLEKGHSGPCMNTFSLECGTWSKNPKNNHS